MIISVASGKGGTGKTTVAVNLTLSIGDAQLLDCDVEEPNAHLFLNPEVEGIEPVYVMIPEVDKEKCSFCRKCADFCAFNALFVIGKDPEKGLEGDTILFPNLCHGCGGCIFVCPENAISEGKREVGRIIEAKKGDIGVVYGELNIGEPMPVPVIKAVKSRIDTGRTVIIDCPPGTSCPVIHSIHGSDYCILVTEPTPFGFHDLKLMVEVVKELDIPFGVVINKEGIGDERVYKYCRSEGIEILAGIPYERRIAELYSGGIPFVTQIEEWKSKFYEIFEKIR